ncbi:MAG: hypothetical protein OXN79_11640 [bacterium]|nr:hypothetical protein [bacterium]MDE0217213.1 hypothetical protein [bacterium]
MSDKSARADIVRCRSDMAELLGEAVAMTGELERWLYGAVGWPEESANADFGDDPVDAFRTETALALRKARIHSAAAIWANKTNSLHSLAVQMRPVLECAGQVVFLFHNLIIAPDLEMPRELDIEVVGARIDADHFHTLRRRTRGQVSAEELLEVEAQAQEAAAAWAGAPRPIRRKKRRFTQEDKVKPLPRGPEWYGYLSEHFCHATAAEWKGLSYRGSVVSTNQVEDELAFLKMMGYLAPTVALMNSAAALCPGGFDANRQWKEWVEPTLAQLKRTRDLSKTLTDTAGMAVTGGVGGSNRTD